MSETGTLFIVATPVGNLKDITYRAVDILGEVDMIACEDTRRTGRLLQHFRISKKLVSYHSFNEKSRVEFISSSLLQGRDVALVSDAGTPMISDPGWSLISACVQESVPVVPVPGPSALTAALSASHLDLSRFFFAGFLPSRSAERKKLMAELASLPWGLVFYEAPHRILTMLDELREILGDREVILCRELTKLHEEILRGTASDVHKILSERETIKGEITLLVERGAAKPKTASVPELYTAETIEAEQQRLRLEGMGKKEIQQQLCRRFNLSRNELYRILSQF